MAESLVDVAKCLGDYVQGSCNEYDKLLSQLSDPDLPNSTIATYLKSLKDCVAILGKDYEVLVGVLLKVKWPGRSGSVVREYKAFILSLLSSHTVYLRACLRMIIIQFRPKSVKTKGESIAMVTDERRKEDEEVFVHLHTLLKAITHTVPMTPTVLLPLLIDHFPFMLLESYVQECYVKNVLQISYYLISERCKLLELIVDRMTRLDVRSPREEIQEAESEEEEQDEEMEQDVIFDMDEVDVSSVMTKGDGSVCAPMTHKEADRLDVMIELVFRYTYNVCHNKTGDLDWQVTKKLYRELLVVFDHIILPTHASCHIQFILFYISSFHEALAEGFLDYLWKMLQNPNTQVVYRQAAAAYISSFLARATHVNISTVRACLDLMAAWAHRYINEATYTAASIYDVSHHATFYSVCQAIFYVVTFRHKELLSTGQGYKHCERLNLQTIVTSRLNPLRMCLPIIAKTFASIMRMHQLAFCDTILERNRRTMFPTTIDGASISMTDAFFPFDPYLLNRSGRHIIPLYREYDGVLAQVTQDESDSEESGSCTEDVHSDQHKACDMSPRKAFSPTIDFNMYGTSPGFKNI